VLEVKLAYSFVILVLMCLITAGLSLFISLQVAAVNNHKFCDVLNEFISVPAPKPADPSAHPSRVKDYEAYVKFVHLDKSLGC
jgi:hypothetical protein